MLGAVDDIHPVFAAVVEDVPDDITREHRARKRQPDLHQGAWLPVKVLAHPRLARQVGGVEVHLFHRQLLRRCRDAPQRNHQYHQYFSHNALG